MRHVIDYSRGISGNKVSTTSYDSAFRKNGGEEGVPFSGGFRGCFGGVRKKRLTFIPRFAKDFLTHGVVAQLGERLNGIQEVVSSILSSSTRFLKLIQVLNQLFLLHGDAQGSHRIFRLALSEYMVVLFQ